MSHLIPLRQFLGCSIESEDFNEPGNLRGLRRQRMMFREDKAVRICGKAYQRKGTAQRDTALEICRGVPFTA